MCTREENLINDVIKYDFEFFFYSTQISVSNLFNVATNDIPNRFSQKSKTKKKLVDIMMISLHVPREFLQ